MHLAKRLQYLNNDRVDRQLGRPMQHYFTIRDIKGSANVEAAVLSHRPMSSPRCAATVLVCGDFRSLSKYFLICSVPKLQPV